jgi:Tol biopolymer transport system component
MELKMKLLYVFIILLLFSCSRPVFVIPDDLPLEEKEKIEKINKNPTVPAFLELAKYYKGKKNSEMVLQSYDAAFSLDTARYDILFEKADFAYTNKHEKIGLETFLKILTSKHSQTYLSRIYPYFISFPFSKISQNDTTNNSFPAVADSSSLLFQTDQNGNWDIAKISLIKDSSQEFILESEANEEHPSLSKSGKYLVFTSDEFDNRVIDPTQKMREILIYQVGFSKRLRLTLNYCDDFYPRFNRHNEEITFVSERADIRTTNYGKRMTNVFQMTVDGTFQIPLTKGNVFDNSGVVVKNGDKTIFSSNRFEDSYNLFEIDNKSKKVDTLFVSEFDIFNITAEKNGKYVYYSSQRNEKTNIFRYNRFSKQEEQLSFMNFADQAELSLDEKKVYFHSNDSGFYQIYFIDLTKRIKEPTVENTLVEIRKRL